MSNDKKAFSGKKADWESWSKKFLLCGKCKSYKKLVSILAININPAVGKVAF